MSNIVFPEGITWNQRYVTGGDFVPDGAELSNVGNLYRYATNPIIIVDFDTSNVVDMSYMFSNCDAKEIKSFDTSNVTSMSHMFENCGQLTSIPQMDTSKVIYMNFMFTECISLTSIPQMDTSSVTSMYSMFNNCNKMVISPRLDMSNVTDVSKMFYYCTSLKEIPDFNCRKVTNFGTSASSNWLRYNNILKKIGVVDCDSVTNIQYFFGQSNQDSLVEFGGCRNLGKASSVSNTNSSYFMTMAPNLTYESVMNVINLLYDRAANGLSNLTLKLHANHMAMLSEDDIAIATNKGWTLTA